MWNIIQHTNIYIMGVSNREKGAEKLLEIMTKKAKGYADIKNYIL